MKELIEALQIFLSKADNKRPTHCEHDELIVDYDPAIFSDAEITRLQELGFTPDHDYKTFYSYKYGSC